MIKTVDEALAKYKEVLREYLQCSKKLKKQYGHADLVRFYEDDFNFINVTNGELNVMVKILGLTKEEMEKIQEEIKAELCS